MSETELSRIASPIFSQVLNAHQSKNYLMLAALLSERAKQGITQDHFIKTATDNLGDLMSAKEKIYLGTVNQQDRVQTVWKVKYEHSVHELLWQMFLVNEGNEIKVDGLLFS